MRELSYNEIINIQDNISRKLIIYINEYLDGDESIEAIDFHYPDFDEDKTSKAFDSWLSIDYKTRDGKTFIKKILEDETWELDPLEKEILRKVEKTYISLYEVLGLDGDYIEVFDLLNKEDMRLWDPKSVNIMKEGDLVFGRLVKLTDHRSFLGPISFLPPSVREAFIEEVYSDYGRSNMVHGYRPFKNYLKDFSINLYQIYTDLVYELIKSDEEFISKLYDELDDFESYMTNYLPGVDIREYMSNLMNFFEYYLVENDLELKDIIYLDFRSLTKKAIEEGFINSKEDFISYLDTFKNYVKFLKCKDRRYGELYRELLEISQDRFLYFDILAKAETPFKINKRLSKGVYRKLSEKAFSTLMDYERFILYILGTPLNLDEAGRIREQDLFELDHIMDNRDSSHSMLKLFYRFSLDKGNLEIHNGFLKVTKKGNQFLRLKDEDKFSLIFSYIWSKNFLLQIAKKYDFSPEDRELFLALLEGLKRNKQGKLEKLVDSFDEFPNIIETHYKYLEIIGIMEYRDNNTRPISITPFGKLVLDLSSKEDNIEKIGKIINLNRYRKTR